MNYNPVVWFEIYCDDLDRAATFYQTVLQIEFRDLDAPPGADEGNFKMKMFPGGPDNGGASGALCYMDGVKAGGGATMVYFGCEDCAVEAGRVEAAGGKVHKPKMNIGEYGNIAIVVDTEGNYIGLHSMK